MHTITFETGDIAYCPYYNYKGIIVGFKTANGQDYVILQNPHLSSDKQVSAKLVTDSVNDPYPVYLQLICKKADYEAIASKAVFGHPSK